MINRSKIGSNIFLSLLTDGNLLLWSYDTAVAAIYFGRAYRTEEFHSTTTSRQINKWLREHGWNTTEEKPQAWFDHIGETGFKPSDDPVQTPDPTTDAEVFVGGITLLIQQPGDERSITRSVEDEEAFVRDLWRIDGFKWVEGNGTSITLINGIIPVTFEVPEGVDLNAFAHQKSQEVLKVWERYAK